MILLMSWYSMGMFMMFLYFFTISMFLFMFKVSIMFEWVIFSVSSFMMEIYVLVDWISMIYMSFVLLISSMIMIYSIEYMKGVKSLGCFMYLVVMFIMSMLIMIMSPSVISILFGWDLLGLVSFCLVIFYQNYSALNSGVVTVLMNRVGDVSILMAIGMFVSYGSWNLYLLDGSFLIILMILIAAITKSAQMPFSIWLPMAMAAPTPVSSLVHSSTLVTAGVYLIIRFNEFIILSCWVSSILLMVSTLTMFMSGLMACYEVDFKKIIALSTLSQLGMMMMVLSLGLSFLGFFHLLTHAVFKSLMFMSVGVVIHLMKDNQDIRKFGGLWELLPFSMMVFLVSLLSLMGYPFLSGFYSKDFIIEMLYLYEMNSILMLMILISLVLTVVYSLRIFYYVFFNFLSFTSSFNFTENYWMSASMVLLCCGSMMIGSGLSWMFFFDCSLIFLKGYLKSLISLLMVSGVVIWLVIQLGKVMKMLSKELFFYLTSMWFMSSLTVTFNKLLFLLDLDIVNYDDYWVEEIHNQIWMNLKLFWGSFKNMFLLQGAVYGSVIFMFFVMMMDLM